MVPKENSIILEYNSLDFRKDAWLYAGELSGKWNNVLLLPLALRPRLVLPRAETFNRCE